MSLLILSLSIFTLIPSLLTLILSLLALNLSLLTLILSLLTLIRDYWHPGPTDPHPEPTDLLPEPTEPYPESTDSYPESTDSVHILTSYLISTNSTQTLPTYLRLVLAKDSSYQRRFTTLTKFSKCKVALSKCLRTKPRKVYREAEEISSYSRSWHYTKKSN
jgi:hypothetical protein